MRIRLAALAASLAGAAALSGCVDDGYGYGGGYSAVSVGYASPGYYGGYDDYGYGGFGSYYGWYGDYYYPGSGFYVYDRDRRPHRWNSGQRRYWQGRRDNWRGPRENGQNWGQFDRSQAREQWQNGAQNRGEQYRRGTNSEQWRNAPQGRPDGYRRGTGTNGQRWEGTRGTSGGQRWEGRGTGGDRGQGRRGRRP